MKLRTPIGSESQGYGSSQILCTVFVMRRHSRRLTVLDRIELGFCDEVNLVRNVLTESAGSNSALRCICENDEQCHHEVHV